MPHVDSMDKVVTSYFSRITKKPFAYKGKEYLPKPLVVSPLLFRGYTCPAGCGACCLRFSLDYLPSESCPARVTPRIVKLNGKGYKIFSDLQEENTGHYCRNLKQENGRCGIYEVRPFSCDFELIRFMEFVDKGMLTQKLYGRGWNMLRIDDKRGAMCEMTDVTKQTTLEVVRKLRRLKQWADYFEIDSHVDSLIHWAQTGPHIYPLQLSP